jgi:membrane protein required for colicin V production
MSMSAVDWVNAAFAALLMMSLLIGLWRGLVYEVLSLLVWLVAWGGAHALAPWAMAWTVWASWTPAARQLAAWLLMFVLVLMAGRLVVWSIQQLLHMSPLAGLDRLLGGLFGLVRGGLIASVIVMLVGQTRLAQHAAWQQATAVQWSQVVLTVVLPWMPGQWGVSGPAQAA